VLGAKVVDQPDVKEHCARLEERLRVLARATTEFARATDDAQRLFETVARLVAEQLKDYCLVQLLNEAGTHLSAVAIYSPDPETLAQAREVLSAAVPVQFHPIAKRVHGTGQPFIAARTQLEALRDDQPVDLPRPPGSDFERRIGVHSMLVVPLRVNDQPIGQITLARYGTDRPPFDDHDLELAQSLAGHASLAISNARRLADARRALVERARVEEQLRILAQASAEFTSATPDLNRLLEVMARRLGELVGDLCFIRALSDDGQLEGPGAVYHRDPEIETKARELMTRDRQPINDGVSGQAMRSGKALISKVNPNEFLATRSTSQRPLFDKVEVTSIMAVPLSCRGEVIGMANLLRTSADRPYTPDDLRLVQSIADYAGLALGNARAYLAERVARAAAEDATHALRSSEARFAHLLESGLLGVLVATLNGKVLQINDALLDMVGYSHKEIISGAMPWVNLTPPEWKAVDQKATEQLVRTGIGDLREKEFLRRDGTRVPVLVGSAMVDSDTRETISFVLDLTDRKQTQSMIDTMRLEHAADAKFRSLLESAPDAMVIAEEGGMIALVNERVEALFGYSRDELLGQSIDLLIQTRLSELNEQAVSELIGRRRDGSLFPIEVSVSPLRTETGLLVSSAIRDITERKRAEQQRANLAAIVDASDDAIIGTDRESIVTSWNQGAERLFGYPAAEMLGASISKILPPGFEAVGIHQTLTRGEVQHFDTVRRRKDGTRVNVSVTVSPVISKGQVVGVSKVARDITARIKNDEALTRAKDAAEAASRELEAFSYSVAHDLRTPLRGMNGFAQVLLDDYGPTLDAEGNQLLTQIVKNARRMGALIDALLSLSRVSRSELRRERINLSTIAGELVKQLAENNPQRTVEVFIAPELWAELDPSLARALLDNLLANAWKFTAKVEQARIEVGATRVGGEPVFYVRDNGAGFSMEYANKLFVAFQRLHAAAEYPGTGIGLATVLRIVRRHGGKIWAEGAVHQGATFFFSVPTSNADQSLRELQPTNATKT